MAVSKVLQKPSILKIQGSTIRVAHPNIKDNPRYYLRSPIAVGGTAVTISDNAGLADDDWLLFGEIGDSKTEEDDINGAVTRGSSLTVTNTLKFAHDLDTPVTKILERKIKLYGAATSSATGTVITSVGASGVSIQWNRQYTDITIISTDTAYAYYYATFYDGTTESSASDYVLATGVADNVINDQIVSAVDMCDETIGTDTKITRDFLLEQSNKWQDEIAQYVYIDPRDGTKKVKNWPFEEAEDTTSLSATENENTYALSSLSSEIKFDKTNQAIISLRFGFDKMDYIDPSEMDQEYYQDTVRTTVSTQATAGQTTMTLSSTAEMSDAGQFYVGADTITYTSKVDSTGVVSGIPASGTGSITETHAVGASVWQGINPGLPEKYTIYNGSIIFNVPVDTLYVGYKIRIKYYKKLSRFVDFSDTTVIPFYNTLETWLRARIETRKGNEENAKSAYDQFYKQLDTNALSNFSVTTDPMDYYSFGNKDYGYGTSNITGL